MIHEEIWKQHPVKCHWNLDWHLQLEISTCSLSGVAAWPISPNQLCQITSRVASKAPNNLERYSFVGCFVGMRRLEGQMLGWEYRIHWSNMVKGATLDLLNCLLRYVRVKIYIISITSAPPYYIPMLNKTLRHRWTQRQCQRYSMQMSKSG